MSTSVFLHRSGLHVVFEPEEDGRLVVSVPDLPGCISQGCSFEDAAMNIDSAIEDYLAALDRTSPLGWTVSTLGSVVSAKTSTADVSWVSAEIVAA